MSKHSRFFVIPSLVLVLGGVTLAVALAEDAKKAEIQKEDGKGGGGGECYKFVAPLEAVMKVMDGIFFKMPDKLKAGNWKDLKRESYFVAEIGNLATHVKEHRTDKEWLDYAGEMTSNALKMADAAGKKDEAGVKTFHAAAEKSCDACHQKFRDN